MARKDFLIEVPEKNAAVLCHYRRLRSRSGHQSDAFEAMFLHCAYELSAGSSRAIRHRFLSEVVQVCSQ